ncbi:hypothetical protein [Clostridium sardiniense]|uniref:hypothetical protein n=1 Tax=Clostridium sardiniense TaxID=29369 RepID=UPI00195D52B3|nr:hypothetical protein [Clostridium sardiniense]MBM7833450.1 hypothetical protein [Clostridium sardiniense]
MDIYFSIFALILVVLLLSIMLFLNQLIVEAKRINKTLNKIVEKLNIESENKQENI